jgi:hypothetical protein
MRKAANLLEQPEQAAKARKQKRKEANCGGTVWNRRNTQAEH